MDTIVSYEKQFKSVLVVIAPLLAVTAWQAVVDESMKRLLPSMQQNSLQGKIMYAVVLTLLTIILMNAMKKYM